MQERDMTHVSVHLLDRIGSYYLKALRAVVFIVVEFIQLDDRVNAGSSPNISVVTNRHYSFYGNRCI